MGILPAPWNGYQHTQPPAVLSPSSHLHYNEDDDCNNEEYQKESGIKPGAKDVADHFTPGHSDHHEDKNEWRSVFHFKNFKSRCQRSFHYLFNLILGAFTSVFLSCTGLLFFLTFMFSTSMPRAKAIAK